jgi:hypothetical protein
MSHTVRLVKPGIQFPTKNRRIDLRAGITGDKPGFLQIQQICQQPGDIVVAVPHGLSAYPDPGSGPQFFQVAGADLFPGVKDILPARIRRA